ncbi:MAG: GNAT family N-acetyltransferase, partial [Pseudomonadales bacterium]|nr:GNAT family N-acetyltransferase [Pseudomonadales bacterium]
LEDAEGRAVGSVSAVREWSDWNAGFYWWIQSMYLVPEQRRKGCMQILLDAVEAEMEARGGLELRLYVHRENVPAVKAYEKAAFERSPYEIMVRRK